VIDRLAAIEDEYLTVEAELSDPAILSDAGLLRQKTTRYKELTPIVTFIRALRTSVEDATAARELLTFASSDERDALRDDLAVSEAEIASLEEEIRLLLLPRDPNDGKAVIVEIRGAEGGEEANLFARDLFDMYSGYAAQSGWAIDVLSTDVSDLGGFNQITFMVKGATAWSHLKYEGGTHRVQRVPVTESQGRIHTSSATVLILAEAEEVEIEIDEKDLQIDVYRASGPGGQGVNTTDSAVRITHKPTGIAVAMQDERSQLQNRARAMTVLRARLLQAAQQEADAKASVERKLQVGTGGRGEKIRTYNYKENRLTDHRIGFTIYRLQEVLAGNLADVVEALAADERTRQLASGDD
jgi:peptide chain release factor 1